MDKLQVEIIKKVLMLSTKTELDIIRDNVMDAISRECDQDDHDQEEFKKWKENQVNGQRTINNNFRRSTLLRLLLFGSLQNKAKRKKTREVKCN